MYSISKKPEFRDRGGDAAVCVQGLIRCSAVPVVLSGLQSRLRAWVTSNCGSYNTRSLFYISDHPHRWSLLVFSFSLALLHVHAE